MKKPKWGEGRDKKKTYGRQEMVRCPSEHETPAPVSSWSQFVPEEPSGAPLQRDRKDKENRHISKIYPNISSDMCLLGLKHIKSIGCQLYNLNLYLSPCFQHPSLVVQERQHLGSDHLETQRYGFVYFFHHKQWKKLNTWAISIHQTILTWHSKHLFLTENDNTRPLLGTLASCM